MTMNCENTIEVLRTWDSRRAELREAEAAASKEVSEASEPVRKARFHVTRIQSDLNFYENRSAGDMRSGGSKADHDQLRDKIIVARSALVEAEAVEKQALDLLESAKQELDQHVQDRPAATKDDIEAMSEKVAALLGDRTRVEKRLLELEGEGEDGPVADASTAVEEAKQQVEKIAAANSLGEAGEADVKQATGVLAKAEDALKNARTNSASRAQAVAGLKRRQKETEVQLEEAEAARRLAVVEYGTAFHHQAVENLNKAMASPAFSRALTDIAIADRLLRHVRSDVRFLGGSPWLTIKTEEHTSISGFDNTRVTADASNDTKASALIEELGL
mgnify:CR=1 FL=1